MGRRKLWNFCSNLSHFQFWQFPEIFDIRKLNSYRGENPFIFDAILSVSGKIYAKIKRKSKRNKNKMKKLCKCMEESEESVIENLERAARFFRASVGPNSWRRKDYKWERETIMAAVRSKDQQQCEK